MASKGVNYQDVMLNYARKDKMQVTIFLTSGYQMKGVIKAFDNFVIVFEMEGKDHMVYKHAISTIVPSRAVAGSEWMHLHAEAKGEIVTKEQQNE